MDEIEPCMMAVGDSMPGIRRRVARFLDPRNNMQGERDPELKMLARLNPPD